jgi:K+-transporting ATPase KdpF subunit
MACRLHPDRRAAALHRGESGLARAVHIPRAWTSSHSASPSASSRCRGASSCCASGCDAMTIYLAGGVVVVALLAYLFVALLAPEKF